MAVGAKKAGEAEAVLLTADCLREGAKMQLKGRLRAKLIRAYGRIRAYYSLIRASGLNRAHGLIRA